MKMSVSGREVLGVKIGLKNLHDRQQLHRRHPLSIFFSQFWHNHAHMRTSMLLNHPFHKKCGNQMFELQKCSIKVFYGKIIITQNNLWSCIMIHSNRSDTSDANHPDVFNAPSVNLHVII